MKRGASWDTIRSSSGLKLTKENARVQPLFRGMSAGSFSRTAAGNRAYRQKRLQHSPVKPASYAGYLFRNAFTLVCKPLRL